MSELEPRTAPSRGGAGKLVLLALAGATAAAWVWNRQGEDALRKRTEDRLRPFPRGSTT